MSQIEPVPPSRLLRGVFSFANARFQSSQAAGARQSRSRSGVTLPELVIVAGAFLVGLGTAAYAWTQWGMIWGIAGFPAGFVGGLVILMISMSLFGLVFSVINGLLVSGIPPIPPCRNGCCTSRRLGDFGDFIAIRNSAVIVDLSSYEEPTRVLFRCRCGDLYQRDWTDGTMYSVDEFTREETLYRKWKPFRGWLAPEEEEPSLSPKSNPKRA
ncbi:hypothetical protein KOR42_47010 [Thalassoglobus neptunius]|uniref:Uncharacterized protein n=1 Tax=Thalassoglobus neptunius TaxID=1938619 RepID=A0A5C5VYK6_9PLAN|nr:hypothetical protein [Thalassoglobus neptunius]TWT42592.1 hypothetical protein KOR42_47010 [Thalassoglobus neptunius]